MYCEAGRRRSSPPAVVTVTSTVPLAPGGAVAVISSGESSSKEVAGATPNLTPVAPPKFFPVIVTFVPPPVDPEDGDSAVTYGSSWV